MTLLKTLMIKSNYSNLIKNPMINLLTMLKRYQDVIFQEAAGLTTSQA